VRLSSDVPGLPRYLLFPVTVYALHGHALDFPYFWCLNLQLCDVAICEGSDGTSDIPTFHNAVSDIRIRRSSRKAGNEQVQRDY
jgi:hypothetical protein